MCKAIPINIARPLPQKDSKFNFFFPSLAATFRPKGLTCLPGAVEWRLRKRLISFLAPRRRCTLRKNPFPFDYFFTAFQFPLVGDLDRSKRLQSAQRSV